MRSLVLMEVFSLPLLPARTRYSSSAYRRGSQFVADLRGCSTSGYRAGQTIPVRMVFHYQFVQAVQTYRPEGYRSFPCLPRCVIPESHPVYRWRLWIQRHLFLPSPTLHAIHAPQQPILRILSIYCLCSTPISLMLSTHYSPTPPFSSLCLIFR